MCLCTIRTGRSEKVAKTFEFVPAELSAVARLSLWLLPVVQVVQVQVVRFAVQQQEQEQEQEPVELEPVQVIRLVS